MTEKHENPSVPESSPGYELRDVQAKFAVIGGIALLGLMLIGLVVSAVLFSVLKGSSAGPERIINEAVAKERLPTGPQIQVNPTAEWSAMKAEQEAILNSYGWLDREAGIVRIPITRAMELLLERGLQGTEHRNDRMEDGGPAEETGGERP